jgi:protein-tyrosine phosphatase
MKSYKQMEEKKSKYPKILFVCLGNICRSPAAEEIMRILALQSKLPIKVDSAGLYHGHAGEPSDRRMRIHASRRGYELRHLARPVRVSDFDEFDLIIGMDDNNVSALKRMAPTVEAENKVKRMADYITQHPGWDYVPDPYYEGAEGFELVLDLLEDACYTLVQKILKQN